MSYSRRSFLRAGTLAGTALAVPAEPARSAQVGFLFAIPQWLFYPGEADAQIVGQTVGEWLWTANKRRSLGDDSSGIAGYSRLQRAQS